MASSTTEPSLRSAPPANAPRLSALPGIHRQLASVSTTIDAGCSCVRGAAPGRARHGPCSPQEAHSVISSPSPFWRSMTKSSNCPSNSAPSTMLCRWALSSGIPPTPAAPISASATISEQRRPRSVRPVDHSPLMLEPRYFSYPWASAHPLTSIFATAAKARNSLTIPSANRL